MELSAHALRAAASNSSRRPKRFSAATVGSVCGITLCSLTSESRIAPRTGHRFLWPGRGVLSHRHRGARLARHAAHGQNHWHGASGPEDHVDLHHAGNLAEARRKAYLRGTTPPV